MINITASKSDERKKETYTMLVLFFNQVQSMASNKLYGWELESVFTDNTNQEFITTYNNGKLQIKAHSYNGDHRYSLVSIDEEK